MPDHFNQKIIRILTFFVTVWVAVGWPQIHVSNISFPPQTQEANAQINLVQSASNTGTNIRENESVSATFNTQPTQDNLVVAKWATQGSADLTSSLTGTYDSHSGHSVVQSTGNGDIELQWRDKVAGSNESSTVTVDVTCSVNNCSRGDKKVVILHIYEYSGVDTDTTSHFDASNSATGSGQAAGTGSISTSNANDLLIGSVAANVADTWGSWQNSFTEQDDNNASQASNDLTLGTADRTVSSTGSYSTGASTGTSGTWVGIITSFQESATLSITTPGAVTDDAGTNNPGTTSSYTFTTSEYVTITDGGAGWTLTVESTNLSNGTDTISNTNMLLSTDGAIGTSPTLIEGTTTNVSEQSAGDYSLDQARTISTRSSGSGGETTDHRPTIKVDIPHTASTTTYTATLTFTVT